MKSLLDTNVISELQRRECDVNVRRFVAEAGERDLYVSVVSIGEIAKGVALLPEGRRKAQLRRWLGGLDVLFADRVLAIDRAVAHIWGDTTAAAQTHGRILAAADGLIAATAIRHGLTVVTRNVGDFDTTGAAVFDPWTYGT